MSTAWPELLESPHCASVTFHPLPPAPRLTRAAQTPPSVPASPASLLAAQTAGDTAARAIQVSGALPCLPQTARGHRRVPPAQPLQPRAGRPSSGGRQGRVEASRPPRIARGGALAIAQRPTPSSPG